MVLDLAKLRKNPSFYKLLYKQFFMDGIQIPTAFIKEHKKMLAKTCLLKTDEGMLWEANIVRDKSYFFIMEGDWPQFALYHKLEVGDVLFFFLIDKSTFQVLPYSRKGCRNLSEEQLFEQLSSNSEEEEEVEDEDEEEEEEEAEVEEDAEEEEEEEGEPDIRASRKGNRVEVVSVISSDAEDDSVDPSSGSKGAEVKEHEEGDEEEELHIRVSKKWKRRKLVPLISSSSKDGRFGTSSGSIDEEIRFHSHSGGSSHAKVDRRKYSNVKMNSGTKKRTRKDPDEPKRPLSAFLVFMEEFRKKFKEENPSNRSVTVVSIAAGEKWKKLLDADKAPYVAEAEKRMAEYQKNMTAYKKAVSKKYIDAYNKLRGLATDPDKP